MAGIVLLAGSPSPVSRTEAVVRLAGSQLCARGHAVSVISVRDLPPAAPLAGDCADPAVGDADARIGAADGIVVGTPIYKAAYSGLLKALLDLLPQAGFAGKAVLPLATGGTLAHMLAIDYALRPVLSSLGARHVLPGYFVLDRAAALADDGAVTLDAPTANGLARSIDALADALAAGSVRPERAS